MGWQRIDREGFCRWLDIPLSFASICEHDSEITTEYRFATKISRRPKGLCRVCVFRLTSKFARSWINQSIHIYLISFIVYLQSWRVMADFFHFLTLLASGLSGVPLVLLWSIDSCTRLLLFALLRLFLNGIEPSEFPVLLVIVFHFSYSHYSWQSIHKFTN